MTNHESSQLNGDEDSSGDPRIVYFYYLQPTPQTGHHHRKLKAFFLKMDRAGPPSEQLISDTVAKADRGEITPIGFEVEDLRWRYKSYIVFVINEPSSTLKGVNFELCPAPIEGGGAPAFEQYQSFEFGDISGVHCVNNRKCQHGHVLQEGESEKYEIFFAFDPPELTGHTESGTNTGP